MSVSPSELKWYGSAVMPDTDATLGIGGAIDTSKMVSFADVSGTLQAVSSHTGDTTQTVTVSYRDSTGLIQTVVFSLNGQTVVTNAAANTRLLKALKSATCSGDVAIEAQSATRANTGQAGGGANHEIAMIISYVGSTKVATVSKNWAGGAGSGTNVITLDASASAVDEFYTGEIIRMTDSSIGFRISKGFFFEKSPAEVLEVRRIFYNAAADPPTGSAKTYYEKIFGKNTNGATTLSSAMVKLISDTGSDVEFGLAASLDDTGTNGGSNNRQVAPAGVSFDVTDQSVPTTVIPAGSRIGVWLKLSLTAGQSPQNSLLTMRLDGLTT
jgi:hypothetical protein